MRLLPEVVFGEGCYFGDRAVTISGGRITDVAPLAPDEAHAPDTVQLPGKALLPGPAASAWSACDAPSA